jgi:hypothetical protein
MRGKADAYNAPIILRMWDSFGHMEHAQAAHANVSHKFDYSKDPASYLRPGDTLTIEIEVDPSFSEEGFTVKWTEVFVDQKGERKVKLVVLVENRHVQREMPIDIKVISHRDWHLADCLYIPITDIASNPAQPTLAGFDICYLGNFEHRLLWSKRKRTETTQLIYNVHAALKGEAMIVTEGAIDAESRRSVLIRSPGLRGINDGATTTQPCPARLNCRCECHSRKGRPHNRTVARCQRATACCQSVQGRRCVRDLAILAHVLARARLHKRDRDRILVHVKAHVCDRLVQDPSPTHEARRRNARRNPR